MPAASDDDVDGHHHHRHHTQTSATTRDLSFFRSIGSIFSNSLQISISNPKLFSYIFLLVALPLSLLLSSLSLSSTSLRRRILHLHSLAAIVSVRIEALNILDDARKDSESLLRLRAIHALVTLPLSILLLIASASLLHRRRRSRSVWWRSLLTGLLSHAARTSASIVSAAVLGPFAGLTVAGEVFLKSVLDMAVVVTVVEEKVWGVEAFVMAWDLMSGRRMVGWAMAAAAELATVSIWWGMVGVEEIDVYGSDWKLGFRSTAGMGLLIWRGGIVILYAALMIWSNVALMVFNSECTAAGFKHVEDDCR